MKLCQVFHSGRLRYSIFFLLHLIGPDAFQPDPESLHLSTEPLIKAATQLMALINSLCAMLQTSPFHRENYSRLILGVVIQFYQRCSDRFQTLTSTGPVGSIDAQVALAAQWAQRPELQPPLTELRKLSVSVWCALLHTLLDAISLRRTTQRSNCNCVVKRRILS